MLYLLFFICCFIYLYYSNIIILRNLIFLFLDFSQNPEDKNTNKSSVSDIIGKLLKFQNLLNDFNLSNIKIFSDYLDKKNIKVSNSDNIKEMKFKSKKTRLHNFHNKKFNINKNDSDINNSQFKDNKSKNSNNSSQNVFLKR